MPVDVANQATRSRPTSLPLRDVFLLPLIGLLTAVFLLGGAEFVARAAWPDKEGDSCMVHDAALGVRFVPDCTSTIKLPETEWVTNHYNGCGYRTEEPCGPKPANTLRIALIGSSTAFGLYVPYEQTTSAALARDLSQRCGRPVEVQNLASEFEFWDVLQHRFDLAMKLQPDAVLVIAGPIDIMTDNLLLPGEQNALPPVELMTRIRNVFADLRLRVVAQHLMYGNPVFYLSLYKNSVFKTIYMRDPLILSLRSHVVAYSAMLKSFAAEAGQHSASVMLAYVPLRAQIGFAAEPVPPPGIDPYALDRALGEAVAASGAAYFDTTRDLVADPLQMDLFTRSDGHIAKAGDVAVAHSLARAIARELPAFRQCRAG